MPKQENSIGHQMCDLRVVVQLLNCVRLCNPMDCSMSDFPVLHYLCNNLILNLIHFCLLKYIICSLFVATSDVSVKGWSGMCDLDRLIMYERTKY